MTSYERITEDQLHELDQLMIAKWDEPRNNFRIALEKLKELRADIPNEEFEIYLASTPDNKGKIIMIPKSSVAMEKAF